MRSKKIKTSPLDFRGHGYRVVKNPYFTLKIKENQLLDSKNRIGVVIGRAAEKSAVRRNFWRRQVKSYLTSFESGRDFVIIFSFKVRFLTKSEFKKIFSEAVIIAIKR